MSSSCNNQSEYRIDLKVRNNIILYKLEKAGYKTLGEVCRLNGMMKYVSSLGDIISMKSSPLDSKGEFKKCVTWISDILGCAEVDLFTDIQMNTVLKTNKKYIAVNEAEMKYMLKNSEQKNKLLEEIIQDGQMLNNLNKELQTLTPREQKIINMRFGLGEYSRDHTLEECGKEFNINRERVRQIEAKALRKLRHPSRSDNLRDFIQY